MTDEKKPRFVTVSHTDAHTNGWYGKEEDCYPRCERDVWYEVWDTATTPPTFIGDDIGEPEDRNLVRDFSWVAYELNRVAKEAYAAGHAQGRQEGIEEAAARLEADADDNCGCEREDPEDAHDEFDEDAICGLLERAGWRVRSLLGSDTGEPPQGSDG